MYYKDLVICSFQWKMYWFLWSFHKNNRRKAFYLCLVAWKKINWKCIFSQNFRSCQGWEITSINILTAAMHLQMLSPHQSKPKGKTCVLVVISLLKFYRLDNPNPEGGFVKVAFFRKCNLFFKSPKNHPANNSKVLF